MKHYNSSLEPIETRQWNDLRFPSSGSALERERSDQEFKTACSNILLNLVKKSLQHISEKWLGHCKNCNACQGGYFEKGPSQHRHKFPTRNNESPRIFQMVFLFAFPYNSD
jgi:hypothetical protein